MRVKTSITLARDVLQELDRIAGGGSNRSRLIEEAIRLYLWQRDRSLRDARDLERIDRAADELNEEMADALEDQA